MIFMRTLHRQIDSDSFTRIVTVDEGIDPLKYIVTVRTLKHPNPPTAQGGVFDAAPEAIKFGFSEVQQALLCAEQQVAHSQAHYGCVLVHEA
jgi:hypothetical protein